MRTPLLLAALIVIGCNKAPAPAPPPLEVKRSDAIGFTKTGYVVDAPQLRTLVATALRDETKAEAALLNKKAIRAALAPGAITRENITALLPAETAVLTVKLKGEVLTKLKTHPEAFILAPAKLEPERDYVVATTDYVYFGGDDLGLQVVAPERTRHSAGWQASVVAWLHHHVTSEQAPLETLLTP